MTNKQLHALTKYLFESWERNADYDSYHTDCEYVLEGLVQPELKPCPTCEALSRTVMLDQTSHDRHKREWVGLTDEHIGIVLNDPNIAEVRQGIWLVLPYAYAYAIEAKSKELNK